MYISIKNHQNRILVFSSWDDGRSPGHANVCPWFLNRYKQLLGPSKLRNCVFLGKYSKWILNFQNWSIVSPSQQKGWLLTNTTCALRN